jgi:hypothetical protein
MAPVCRFLRHKFRFHPYFYPSKWKSSAEEKIMLCKEQSLKNVYQKETKMKISLDIVPSLVQKTHYFNQRYFPSVSLPNGQLNLSTIPIQQHQIIQDRLNRLKLLHEPQLKKELTYGKPLLKQPEPTRPDISVQEEKIICTNMKQLTIHSTLDLSQQLQNFLSLQKIPLELHQIEALQFFYQAFIIRKQHAVLFIGPMGSGKSRCGIEFAHFMKLPFLILTTKEIVPHLSREVEKWSKNDDLIGHVQDGKFFSSDMVIQEGYKLIIVDECHILVDKKTKKIVKELSLISQEVFIICFSGTPGDIEDQLDFLRPFDDNVSLQDSILQVYWQPPYKPKEELIRLNLTKQQSQVYEHKKEAILILPEENQEYQFMQLRMTLSSWKIPFIIQLCNSSFTKSKKSSILVVSEFSEIISALHLQLGKQLTRKIIIKNTKNIDLILQEFESKKFQFLLAYSGYISHGIDLPFVNELIFIEPQYKSSNQRQTNARLPRLGHPNPDQKIISPYYIDTPDDTLYEQHFEMNECPPALE